MKYFTPLLFLFVLIFLAHTAFSLNSDIVGVWIDTDGNYYDFRKNGAFYGYNMEGQKKIVGVAGTYKVVEQSIIITIKKSKSDKINPGDMEEIPFEIKNGLLIFFESGKELNRLKKVK